MQGPDLMSQPDPMSVRPHGGRRPHGGNRRDGTVSQGARPFMRSGGGVLARADSVRQISAERETGEGRSGFHGLRG